MSAPSVTDAFFLAMAGGRGQRFALHHRPVGAPIRGSVLYVHPFAEEMNKARRMAAQQSRALAKAGYAVLQIDLLGCGDSSGDFSDATWNDWLEDIAVAADWMRARYDAPLTLWGLRAGCLLAAHAAERIVASTRLLLWQPATSGKVVFQQFMRLKLAADLQSGASKGALDALRAQLAAGNLVEIAGYGISAALAGGLERATLALPARALQLAWFEVSPREGATLLPASASVVEAWRGEGRDISTSVVRGPAFWQTTEVEEAPVLISATTAALMDMQHPEEVSA